MVENTRTSLVTPASLFCARSSLKLADNYISPVASIKGNPPAARFSSRKPADVRRHTVESLKVAPLGDGHHGRDFYKYFFTSHPEHRHFYKGAENYTGEDVENSERFDKLGDAILLFVHVLANVCENESVYRAFVRRVMYEHFERSIDPALWKPFWDYWTGFLESKGATLTAEQKEAWKNFGTVFNAECQAYLTRMERPHA